MPALANLASGNIAPDPDDPAFTKIAQAASSGSIFTDSQADLPVRCVDGRHPVSKYPIIGPCAPGAVLQLVVGAAPTVDPADPLWGARDLFDRLSETGHPIVEHTSGGQHTGGCGAIDSASAIWTMIGERSDLVVEAMAELHLPHTAHGFEEALRLYGRDFDTQGFYELAERHADATLVPLAGQHQERAIILNGVAGRTVDFDAIDSLIGPGIEIFTVDTWCFEPSAAWLHDSLGVETEVALSAMSAFTVATLATLIGPEMPVIFHT